MNKFQSIIQSQLSRYPLSQIKDLYKLTHQAALGSEHAVCDLNAAQDWLFRELEKMVNNSTDPLIDEISPDGQIVRIHLKPFIDSGGDPEILLEAFIRTANEFKGSIENLIQNWMKIERLAESGELDFKTEELRSFFSLMEYSGFPAVHHSQIYRDAYHPHYRIVSRDYVHQVIPGRVH
ncbi:hypothetical protein ACFLY4_10610 [Chloroflexota bacterium]